MRDFRKNRNKRTALPLIMMLIIATVTLCGCAGHHTLKAPLGQQSFAEYRQQTLTWIEQNRTFLTENKKQELEWNAPAEWHPKHNTDRGVLLIHGLGDSPWSFSDIGPVLASHGFLVRTVLLPGCGTKPEDLLGVHVDDWRKVVAEQAAILRAEVREVYLGGFSTGANLAVEYAMQNPTVQGLILFSPALWSDEPLDFLAPVASLFVDWIVEPNPKIPTQSTVRYDTVPTNAFAQFYRTSVSARSLLRKQPYEKPAFLVLAEHDSVLDSERVLRHFDSFFTHPGSRLIWYGNAAKTAGLSSRVLTRPDSLPEWRISSFSHMAALFSPENPEYGFHGNQRICRNGQSQGSYAKCLAGDEVWFSAYGDTREGRAHARLTFNPYFSWQTVAMLSVLQSE